MSACAPSYDVLFRDFQRTGAIETATIPELREIIEDALLDAGWMIADETVEPAVTTQPRTHARWLIYRVTVELEALPLGGNHVRVLIHPHREYAWGTRSKYPYLTAPIRRRVMPDLERAFARRGLTLVEPERFGTR
jgi:hypothetical protein